MNRHIIFAAVVLFLLLVSSVLAGWTPPTVVGPPISTPYQDYSAYLTKDGRTMYLASDRPGTMGQRDLLVAQKVAGTWRTPVNLGSAVNSTYDDRDPMVDETETLLFFTSNRPSPYGGYWPFHLYWSRKVRGVWQPAEDMGPPINSSSGEECPFLYIDHGDTFFYFASYCRPGGQGEWDIWKSHRSNGNWEIPVSLDPPMNTGYLDAAPYLTTHVTDKDAIECDKIRMYFTSMRPGGSGHIDLWTALRQDGVWQTPENLGPIVNWSYRSDRPCFIDDGKDEDAILYFSDDNRSGGIGSWDIWMTSKDKGGSTFIDKSGRSQGSVLVVHPNPFAYETSVRYLAPLGQPISLKVYDLNGRLVKVLAQEPGDGQMHTASWDGRDLSGRMMPNGAYFLKLDGMASSKAYRLILVR